MIPTKIDAARYPWLPYIAPMFAFLLLTAADGAVDKSLYPIAYSLKIAIVVLVVIACRSSWRDLKPRPSLSAILAAIVLGVIVAAGWVLLDGHYPEISLLGKRTGYDPSLLKPMARAAFLATRFFGLVMVVPLIEELFWRSFLIRWLIEPDFQNVPVGKVTRIAAALTSVGFAIGHPEWLPGLLTGLIWAGLLAWSKSVSACVISHAVANLALGIYVVKTGGEAWKFL